MFARTNNCASALAIWCGGYSMHDAYDTEPCPSSSSSESSSESDDSVADIQDTATKHCEEDVDETKQRNSDTTFTTNTSISIQSPHAANINITTTMTYSADDQIHEINTKHIFFNVKDPNPKPRVLDASISADASHIINDTNEGIPFTMQSDSSSDASFSASSSDDDTNDHTATFARAMSEAMGTQKLITNKVFSQIYVPTIEPIIKHRSDRTYSYTPTPSAHTKYTLRITKPETVAAIFYQLTSIKKLDNASQINVVLDDFLTDYPVNNKALPYKYLFRNDIIGNLIFAWHLGVQKINSTLITYAIRSLCMFTKRDEFREPFVSKKGMMLIDKTLTIPSLQTPTSANTKQSSTPTVSDAFAHILAVLQLTSDICKCYVLDPKLCRSGKIHQKVLSAMKRDCNEENITKACRNTLIDLLDVCYELGEDIIKSDQIHGMIDSFLKSTKRDYLNPRTLSLHRQGSVLLAQPLFVHGDSHHGDLPGVVNDHKSSSKKHIKHEKRKNLLQLEEEAKNEVDMILSPRRLITMKDTPHEHTTDMLTGDMLMGPVDMESSEYLSDDEEDEYESGIETETETEDDTDEQEETDQDDIYSKPHLGVDASSHLYSSAHSTRSATPFDETGSQETNICYGSESEHSILSLEEYDAMVEEAETNKEQQYCDQFEFCGDFNADEKAMVTQIPSLHDIYVHSVNIHEDAVEMDIELESHELLYISSLFHILYKIITLKRSDKRPPNPRKSSNKNTRVSFMEMLQNRKKRDRKMSGGTAGGLSQMDAVCMSDSELIRPKKELKPINEEKNKLLELFFGSLSFKNLFKLVKYYRLSSAQDTEDIFEFGANDDTIISKLLAPLDATKTGDTEVDNSKMIPFEKLACKILRKILSYSQIITDKLLIDDELDVIGILVTLLFRNPSNIDLIIYILDIFSKISKDNDDIRDLLLDPRNFDKFLRALDPWWMIVIESTAKLTTDTTSAEPERVALAVEDKQTKKPQTFLHLQLMEPVTKVLSVDSIGIADNHPMEDALHIEVTIAMLKFFKDLSESNALDMVDYGINDRILVLLDYYLNISIKYDPYDDESLSKEHNFDLNMDYSF
eukprot:334218_1